MDTENKETTLTGDELHSDGDRHTQLDKSMDSEKKEGTITDDHLHSIDERDSQRDKGPDKDKDSLTSDADRDSQHDDGGPDKSSETEKKVTAQNEDSLTSDRDSDSQQDEGPDKSMQTEKNDTAQNQDRLLSSLHDAIKSMEPAKKNREIMFSDSDSDGESEINNNKQFKGLIDTLADEIIEDLAEETVSKYYAPKTNDRSEADKKLSIVTSSDLDSGDEDNFSLAKLKALNQLKQTLLESTPMSMEEYRLRNEEKLDSRTINKKFIKSNTESSITDEATRIDSDESLTASTSYTLSNSDGTNSTDPGLSTSSTNIKSDTTISNDRESDSSGEMIVITRRSNRKKKKQKEREK